MDTSTALPAAVRESALLDLARDHHPRQARSVGSRELAGHVAKLYVIEAPGRSVTESDVDAAARIAAGHLAGGAARGSLGLAVVVLHAGADGDYLLVHTWIEGYMSDLAVFTGPAGQPHLLRPGRAGLAPCTWEAALIAHEREAFVRTVLTGRGPLADRLAAWRTDTDQGAIR